MIQVLPALITGAVIVLELAVFRYDGAAHRPGISSVTLNGITLTAGVDYTAQIPEGIEAGTYTVTGIGSYTGTATAAFTVNPVTQKPLDQMDDDGHELRLEVETGLSTVPAALKNDARYDTPKKIETALRTKAAEVLQNVGEQIAVFDVALQYKDSSGAWLNVDPDNFSDEGVTAILPCPDGTGAARYTFIVQHLISSGDKAGEMETLAYELTTAGLKCRFRSLSPVAIGYQAAQPVDPVSPMPPISFETGWTGVSAYAVTVEGAEHDRVTSFPAFSRDIYQSFYSLMPKPNADDALSVQSRKFNASILESFFGMRLCIEIRPWLSRMNGPNTCWRRAGSSTAAMTGRTKNGTSYTIRLYALMLTATPYPCNRR